MVSALLALETGQGGREAIDSLFRDAHTIKGGAGMLRLNDLQASAHAVEDVLEGIRASGEFPTEFADTLLRAVDVMRRQLSGTGESEDVSGLLEELQPSTREREAEAESVRSDQEPAARAARNPGCSGEDRSSRRSRRRVSPASQAPRARSWRGRGATRSRSIR